MDHQPELEGGSDSDSAGEMPQLESQQSSGSAGQSSGSRIRPAGNQVVPAINSPASNVAFANLWSPQADIRTRFPEMTGRILQDIVMQATLEGCQPMGHCLLFAQTF